MYQGQVLEMDVVNDFPENGPLPGVIVYYNGTKNDSSAASSDIFSANDYIGNNNSYLSIPHDTELNSAAVQDRVRKMKQLPDQESLSPQEEAAQNN